ncbi:MAG: DEAD/DEAH box helicase [Cyclobacteriaceae bacterium]|nr:DEAD/DEAH box helicase [Cyclobacteriaceae bacterium]MCX7637698.1 DEAD/DEAH box helicase [Cyclobacteriaceae bacterium]MDW8330837.1 DEAD/DEAH box helicase [Cyclobacteriaceae bacterium]
MKVSAAQPFQIVYSLYLHEYLGYLFESYIVHLDDRGRLTYQHQNISSKNAREFARGLDENDFELVRLMDSIQQEVIVRKFSGRPLKPEEFFPRVYHPEKGEVHLQEHIELYLEEKRAAILELLKGKMLFEMGNDGEPTHRKIEVLEKRASVHFHFKRTEKGTVYFPTILHEGKRVDLPNPSAYLVCKNPAWLVLNNKLYGFEKFVDGKKLQPFLTKKEVSIPKNLEETYYNRFVAPLIASFDDVEASGFEINKKTYDPMPVLTLSELQTTQQPAPALFGGSTEEDKSDETGKIYFDLSFKYGKHRFQGRNRVPVSVTVEQINDDFVFHRVVRCLDSEKKFLNTLQKLGLPMKDFNTVMSKSEAFSWLNENRVNLLNLGFEVAQPQHHDKKYFVGKASIEIEVKESIDWFDIHAKIKFGDFEIPFKELRKLILKKKVEFKLPNGEIAIIPESWLTKYADLFALSESEEKTDKAVLRKHHLNLVRELEESNLAKVHISEKLRQLTQFTGIKDYDLPKGFQGELRPYQKAGYNWLRFLNDYRLGGCLADDMGLGKTVQALALLQSEKEAGRGTSLVIMPTSLIYNWEVEAARFTPQLRVLTFTGTQRNKDIRQFDQYDVILTSYGITRLDIDLLRQFYFNYIILDESQVIKNPSSIIAKAVRELRSRYKLTLTGTPLENTAMDLWSQMTFINPGLLGSQSYFRQEYQLPIEKKNDEARAKKLNAIIKPFILRRHKSQVLTELPEKAEYIHYSEMTPEQAKKYEETKSYYRSKILDLIDREGMNNSRFMILEGLTKLRQLANHPRMLEPSYSGDSGKMEDITHMLENALLEGHKVLVFSQFVKHLDIIRQHLRKQKTDFAYLDGSSIDRREQVEKFNNNPAVRVFLISIKAGGLGLNLTQADYVFILDPWWNPAVEAQAVDRAYRIGQKQKVFTYKFITRNSVEEKILVLQQKKLKLTTELIPTEESIMKQLTREDVLQMLS